MPLMSIVRRLPAHTARIRTALAALGLAAAVIVPMRGQAPPATSVPGTDWPQWRGPDRSGISRETGLLKQWPASGPAAQWSASALGAGYGSVAVKGTQVFVQGLKNRQSVVTSLGRADGKVLWTRPIGPGQENEGVASILMERDLLDLARDLLVVAPVYETVVECSLPYLALRFLLRRNRGMDWRRPWPFVVSAALVMALLHPLELQAFFRPPSRACSLATPTVTSHRPATGARSWRRAARHNPGSRSH